MNLGGIRRDARHTVAPVGWFPPERTVAPGPIGSPVIQEASRPVPGAPYWSRSRACRLLRQLTYGVDRRGYRFVNFETTRGEDVGHGTALTTNVGHENRVLSATVRESPVSRIPSLSQSTAMPGSASPVGEGTRAREPPTGALVLSRGTARKLATPPETPLALIERATRGPFGLRLRTPSVSGLRSSYIYRQLVPRIARQISCAPGVA